jgi:hypothetical protein
LRGTVKHANDFSEEHAELVGTSLTRQFEGRRIHRGCGRLDLIGLCLEEPKQFDWER